MQFAESIPLDSLDFSFSEVEEPMRKPKVKSLIASGPPEPVSQSEDYSSVSVSWVGEGSSASSWMGIRPSGSMRGRKRSQSSRTFPW